MWLPRLNTNRFLLCEATILVIGVGSASAHALSPIQASPAAPAKTSLPAQKTGAPTPPAPPAAALELVFSGERVQRAVGRDVPIEVIAKEISKALKVPVKVAPEIVKTKVTLRILKDAPLADLLTKLAPAAFVDVREHAGEPSALVGIHIGPERFEPPNEESPMMGAFVEGNTDDDDAAEAEAKGLPVERKPKPTPSPTPEPEGPFLSVSKDEVGRVSVSGRDQGLGTILFAVAQAYRVRFDLRVVESPMIPSVSIVGALPSEVPQLLGLESGAIIRRNVASGEERPLRFFVEPNRK